jgi:hypothetical protein
VYAFTGGLIMNNCENIIRRYLNLHDNAYHLNEQLKDVSKVLDNLEDKLKNAVNGKRFIDLKGRTGYIEIGTDSKEKMHSLTKSKVSLRYDNNEITVTSFPSLKNLTIIE